MGFYTPFHGEIKIVLHFCLPWLMIRLSVIGIFLGVVSEQMKRRIAPPFHLFILTVSSALFSQHHNDAAAQYGHGSEHAAHRHC